MTFEDNGKKRHTYVDGYKPTPHRSRKDTKKWCGGKAGREHKPEWVGYDECKRVLATRHTVSDWYLYRCTACKRELDSCYPWANSATSRTEYCAKRKHKHEVPPPAFRRGGGR